jgi:predicted dehydrogenase
MAGGGPLPDVGIYAINAARFVSGEEPISVVGQTYQAVGDARFREVETSVQFLLKFPSGFTAAASASYDSHRSQFMRVDGNEGWAELNPAFAYQGLQLRLAKRQGDHDAVAQVVIDPKDQFATELDHMAECVLTARTPHTPGEEGEQDLKIIEAIYRSAASGTAVSLSAPPQPTRGPALKDPA